MPYVERAGDGRVVGIYANAQPGYAEEWLEEATIEHTPEHSRELALAALIAAVTAVRLRYTGLQAVMQGEFYNYKLADAQAYISAGRPTETTPFIWLTASADGTGRTPAQEADAIIAVAAQWTPIATATERLRMAGAKAINSAQTIEEIEAARESYVSQLAAL